MLTLASDFGSPYPAAMRAAIARRTDARILDVAHDFPRQDVRTTAFWLREVLPYFPPAVHCAVVDPGVGSERDALAIRVGDHALVGPDNGLLLPAARALCQPAPTAGAGLRGIDAAVDGSDDSDDSAAEHSDARVEEARIEEPSDDPPTEPATDRPEIRPFRIVVDEPESATFHGRDVFAPAAAAVHEAGVEAMDARPFLEPVDDVVGLAFPSPALRADGATATVLVVDGFGNAVTNVPGDRLAGRDSVAVDGERAPVVTHYGAVDAGERLVTVGSHGKVELAANRGRGSDAFGVAPGDDVELRFG